MAALRVQRPPQAQLVRRREVWQHAQRLQVVVGHQRRRGVVGVQGRGQRCIGLCGQPRIVRQQRRHRLGVRAQRRLGLTAGPFGRGQLCKDGWGGLWRGRRLNTRGRLDLRSRQADGRLPGAQQLRIEVGQLGRLGLDRRRQVRQRGRNGVRQVIGAGRAVGFRHRVRLSWFGRVLGRALGLDRGLAAQPWRHVSGTAEVTNNRVALIQVRIDEAAPAAGVPGQRAFCRLLAQLVRVCDLRRRITGIHPADRVHLGGPRLQRLWNDLGLGGRLVGRRQQIFGLAEGLRLALVVRQLARLLRLQVVVEDVGALRGLRRRDRDLRLRHVHRRQVQVGLGARRLRGGRQIAAIVDRQIAPTVQLLGVVAIEIGQKRRAVVGLRALLVGRLAGHQLGDAELLHPHGEHRAGHEAADMRPVGDAAQA